MKRFIKYLSFTIIAISLFSISPKALVSKLTPSSSNVAPNSEFNITITLSGLTNGLASADYIVDYDSSKVTYVSYKIGQGKNSNDIMLNSSIKNQIYISYLDSANGSNALKNGNAITLTFKAKSTSTSGTTTFQLSGSGYGDSVGNTITGNTLNTTINFYKPSNEASLKSLSVTNFNLNPSFNSSTKTYTLPETETDSIYISATASDKATISGTGKRNLNYGENTINVVVTAEDKVTKNTYIIKVTRADNRSNNNKLKTLSIEGIDLEFDPSTYSYQIDIPEGVTTLNINAEAEDEKATIYGIGNIDIGTDLKSHVVSVTAENGDRTSYSIIFTNRSDENSNEFSTELSKLIINNININLNEGTTYLFGVDNDIKDLDIKYETKSPTAKVDITNATSLITGISKMIIKISDGDLTPQEYIFLIHKNHDYTKVNSFAEVTSKNAQEDLIVELDEDANKTIYKSVLKTLQGGSGKIQINVVNGYKGLLYSLTFDKNLEIKEDLDLTFEISKQNPLTFTSSLPAGVVVQYYVGDTDINSLKLYGLKSKDKSQVLIEDNLVLENGYITFTTNGSDNYIISGEMIEESTCDENSTNPFIYILLGIVIGIASTLVSQCLLKKYSKQLEPITEKIKKFLNKIKESIKKLLPKKKNNEINSVIARKDAILAEKKKNKKEIEDPFAVDPLPETEDHYFDMDAPFLTASEKNEVLEAITQEIPVVKENKKEVKITQVFQKPGPQKTNTKSKQTSKIKKTVKEVINHIPLVSSNKAVDHTKSTITKSAKTIAKNTNDQKQQKPKNTSEKPIVSDKAKTPKVDNQNNTKQNTKTSKQSTTTNSRFGKHIESDSYVVKQSEVIDIDPSNDPK